jgi:hypothetical protein
MRWSHAEGRTGAQNVSMLVLDALVRAVYAALIHFSIQSAPPQRS